MDCYEDQEDEQEGELGLAGPNYNDTRPKPMDTTPPPPPQQLRKSRYKECLKNHAVNIGGHAVDGCGEFIPAGEDGTLESLKCAACNCHRNFHRKENEPISFSGPPQHHQLLLPHHPHGHHFGYRGGPSGYLHVSSAPPHQQRQGLLPLPSSSGGGDDQMEEDNNYYSNNPSSSGGSGKKRFRTKFTQEQKDKMLGFAERLGWRLQKKDEEAVQQFCSEVGIKRHVLKVWMHNNKHTLGKKILGGGGGGGGGDGGDGGGGTNTTNSES